MNGSKLHSTLREIHAFARSRHFWVVFFAIIVMFATVGPFGTSEHMTLAPRLAFWLINMASGTGIAVVCSLIAANYLDGLIASRFARILIGSLLSSFPIGLLSMLLVSSWHNADISWNAYFKSLASSLPLCAILPLFYWTALRHEPQGETNAAAPARKTVQPETVRPVEPPPLLARLKPENRGPILRLSAEDHYTETVTTRGRELLLIRFSDALQELGDTEGMQIHRSHWVARAHFQKLETRNGKLMAILKNGSELPVSRSFAASAKAQAAHWSAP